MSVCVCCPGTFVLQVRLGRGWMFWGVTMQLTEAGEAAVDHVLATLFRGVQVRGMEGLVGWWVGGVSVDASG